MYDYQAKVLKIVDGDTIHLEIDLGLETYRRIKCRLYGINAPELNTEAGQKAKAFLADRIPVGTIIRVCTIKDKTEKYGRYLIIIGIDDDYPETINDLMIEAGHAIKYEP